MGSDVWDAALDYLAMIAAGDFTGATDLLDADIEREGVGACNEALADVCRSLMDHVTFDTGTIDVLAAIDWIALRVIDTLHDTRREAIDRYRSLIVYLGSEGLPCTARDDVASWSAEERLHATISCAIGLLGAVAVDEDRPLEDVVRSIVYPAPPPVPEGAFGLAWRGPNQPEPLAGVFPRGYTARITFLGEQRCSLRSIFARVASLRSVPNVRNPHADTDKRIEERA